MSLINESANLSASGRVQLIKVDGTEFGAGVHRLHYAPFPHTPAEIIAANGDEDKLGPKPIIFGGESFEYWPFDIDGVDMDTEQAAQPNLSISNLDGTLTALNLQFKNMLNAKVSIIDTYVTFLDAENFPNGNPNADPTMFNLQTYWLDTKSGSNDEQVVWSLSSPADLQGLVIPTRTITGLCEWMLRDQYRSGDGCAYSGSAYFDVKGNPVSDPALDVCGGCLSDCRKRFGAGLANPNSAALDFGGFPGANLIAK